MNWKVFELKYDKRETWAFEQMSYLLFCAELGSRIGLFRYKNQTGIETEPIEKDKEYYAFQAKYYTTSIADNKDDIIDSIKKAKSKNGNLTVLYLYTNQELSESSKKDKKKPQYQIEIENAAQAIGIRLEWRVPSHIELQLSQPENKYIFDIFYNLEPNEGDLLEEVLKHNESILNAIQTNISFNEQQIKIDRSHVIEELVTSLQNKQNIIIAGEGGCGKTALFKEFYLSYFRVIPICIFKATELNVTHISDLFRFEHSFSFIQFLEGYQNETTKIFVIDSAEKLAELSNNNILNQLIQALKEAGWIIVFTTRYSYLNDLSFHIKENFRISCEVIKISLISSDDLQKISKEFHFALPGNEKFVERLKNLFYLSEYLQFYPNIDTQGNFKGFIDLLWKKRVQNNTVTKDDLHIERGRCLIQIAKKRCNTGRFYINAGELSRPALFQLKLDEILGYSDINDGYFITHDIYEEWALDKIVSSNYSNHSDTKQFFDELGDSLPIRRAFRLWLSDQLSDNNKEIESFIQRVFKNNTISQFWKDELVVSVLLSDYSATFFQFFEKEIVADDFRILKRILFLLRIACTDISAFTNNDVIVPKGKGWETTIAFIHKYRVEFLDNNLQLILPVLTDWSNAVKNGDTTRLAGLLALRLVRKTESEEHFYMNDDVEEKVFKVVFDSAHEIQSELKEVFDSAIDNKWMKHNDPYEQFCSKILEKPYLALEVIKVLPLSIIKLCDLHWQKREIEDNEYYYERDSMASRYGIADEYRHDYFPASAHQTPIYWLLRYNFEATIEFIINFTNRAVKIYKQSDYGKKDVEAITLHVNGKKVTQYSCQAFWGMYRGISSPVVPYLLQSIHMALEKILLEFAQIANPEIVQSWLLKILTESRSTSLTAVVSSIVLAHTDKFNEVALNLFKTIELFHLDTSRSTNEFQAKSLYSIGYGMDKLKDILYSDERIKTCEDKHRNSNLESQFLTYQLTGVKGFTEKQNSEFIEKLYKIIDEHKSDILSNPKSEEKSWGILLVRMDRRNLKPKISERTDNGFVVEFTPIEFPDELKRQSEEAQKQFEETYKYSALRLWSDFLRENESISPKVKEYNNNPISALSETKQLVDELNSGRNTLGIFDYSIPAFSCSKLMIEYKEQLSKEDKDFCKEVIISSVLRLFYDDYDYQISDGVEASVHAIPSLIAEYPADINDFVLMLVVALLDQTPIGHYKRVCDYVIESIHKSELWKQHPTIAQAVLLGYIRLKPIYRNVTKEVKKKTSGHWGRISKSAVLEELNKEFEGLIFTEILFDINDIDLFDTHDLEIIYLLIPSTTANDVHLKIYEKSLPLLAPKLLMSKRDYGNELDDDSNIYSLRIHIFKRVAYFILERSTNEIDIYLQPFIDSIAATEETSSFLDEIVSAEDGLYKHKQFWYIWNKFYPKIVEMCKVSRSFHLQEVIISYFLAWRWWREGIEEWRSLKNDDLSLYNNAAHDLAHIPSVLYAITKVLNSIASNFKNEGIDWVYTIVSNDNMLQLEDLEPNTLFYLEKFIRKFVFLNKQKIKEDIRLKNKVIPILDFMIERGSIHGYLLRESIL